MFPPPILRHRLAFVLATANLLLLLGRTAPAIADTWTFVGLDREIVTSLVVSPSSGQMWAGLTGHFGTASGVWYSNDSGENWQNVNVGLGDFQRPPDVLALAQGNPFVLYAGTAEDGVYKSTNGATWVAAREGMVLGPVQVHTLVIDPTDSQTVYAATSTQGIYKTTDGAALWIPQNNGLEGNDLIIQALAIDPQSPQTLYAATWNNSVFKTTDGGELWAAIDNGLGAIPTSDIFDSLLVDPSDPQTVYLSTYVSGVFQTVDGGATWRAANNGLPVDASGATSIFGALGIDDDSSQVVYVAGHFPDSSVFKSGDSGAQWSSDGFDSSSISSFVDDPAVPHRLFATTSNGIYATQPSTSGGGGCRVASRDSGASASWLLAPLLLASLARRARRWQ